VNMKDDISVHLEFRGKGEPTGYGSVVFANPTAFQQSHSSAACAAPGNSLCRPASGGFLLYMVCAFVLGCTACAAAQDAMANSEKWGPREASRFDNPQFANGVIDIHLVSDRQTAGAASGSLIPDLLIRLVLYGPIVFFVAVLLGHNFGRQRRLDAAIDDSTKLRSRRRRAVQLAPTTPSAPPIYQLAPEEATVDSWRAANGPVGLALN
jgi:hypothetical protein